MTFIKIPIQLLFLMVRTSLLIEVISLWNFALQIGRYDSATNKTSLLLHTARRSAFARYCRANSDRCSSLRLLLPLRWSETCYTSSSRHWRCCASGEMKGLYWVLCRGGRQTWADCLWFNFLETHQTKPRRIKVPVVRCRCNNATCITSRCHH